MTIERAMEILDPNHREHYSSIDVVNEACEMGRKALEKQIPQRTISYFCSRCYSRLQYSNLHEDHAGNLRYWSKEKYCPQCGQAIDWGDD